MITPEALIAAFLRVWENNPDAIFETSGAIQGLDTLQQELAAADSGGASSEAIATKIGEWCQDYPELTAVVVAEESQRKIKPHHNVSPQDSNTLRNQYPEISRILRERVPKIGEGKPSE